MLTSVSIVANTSQKKVGVAILILEKANIRARKRAKLLLGMKRAIS